jgi:hypothetical protein
MLIRMLVSAGEMKRAAALAHDSSYEQSRKMSISTVTRPRLTVTKYVRRRLTIFVLATVLASSLLLFITVSVLAESRPFTDFIAFNMLLGIVLIVVSINSIIKKIRDH